MHRVKKFFLVPIIIVCLFCGCGRADYPGRDKIERARSLHTALSGADITVTDNISGEAVQKISYLFVGEVMTYMYEGNENGTRYLEFNNGTELDWITLPDESEWSFASKGSEGYYGYSKALRHYFSDGKLLLAAYEAAIEGAELNGDTLSLSYDEEKLSGYSSFDGMDITDFSMSYTFGEKGECTSFTNEYTADGAKHSYTVTIAERTETVKRTEIGSF